MFRRKATHLPKENMPDSRVNVLINRLTGGDHVPILEFHGLGTLSPQFSTYNNLKLQIQLLDYRKKINYLM
jgi:hypothetical protein